MNMVLDRIRNLEESNKYLQDCIFAHKKTFSALCKTLDYRVMDLWKHLIDKYCDDNNEELFSKVNGLMSHVIRSEI